MNISQISASHDQHRIGIQHTKMKLPDTFFCFKMISPQEVLKVICKMKTNTSAGPDGIEAKCIKYADYILMYPSAELFNLSLTTNSLPSTVSGNALEQCFSNLLSPRTTSSSNLPDSALF